MYFSCIFRMLSSPIVPRTEPAYLVKDEDFNFVKLDVDKYSDIAREYGVMSIPTIILFENGNEVKRFTGFMSKDEFIKFLK